MAKELMRMSEREINRAEMVRRVLETRLTQAKAADLLGMSVRQVKRTTGQACSTRTARPRISGVAGGILSRQPG